MIDRKILACMLAIGLVSMLATTVTLTWLSDTEITGWEIQILTADLEIEPEDLTFEGAAPGESTSLEITVKNVGEVSMTVTLFGSCNEGDWATFEFSPNDFDLDAGYQTTVTVTMTVSGDYTESGGTLTGTITASGVQVQP